MNRMLPVASRRTKLLPDGGNLPDELLDEFAPSIAQTVGQVGAMRWDRVRRSVDADALWVASYAELRRDRPDGSVAKMLARAAPQTLRLALTYALADGAHMIEADHLGAALAIWRYVEQSAEWLFGGEVDGKEVAALVTFITEGGTAGRTRTEISVGHYSRNKPAAEITAALGELLRDGRIRQETDRSGRGRPAVPYLPC
jgi:hypothetical protein